MQNIIIKNLFFFLFTALCCSSLQAQQSLHFSDPDRHYREALDLLEKRQLSSAQEIFYRLTQDTSRKYTLIQANAAYYYAWCAMELMQDNALYEMERFIAEYPESSLGNQARFHLALHHYLKKHYDDAIHWFAQTDHRDLNGEELAELHFKTGYSFFMMGDHTKAQESFFIIRDAGTRYSPAATYYYAHIAYEDGNYQTALTNFQKLNSDPVFGPVIPYYTAQIYFLQRKYDEVIAYAPPLLDSAEEKRRPELARIIGESFYQTERFDEAIPFLKQYHGERKPTREELYQLGYAYFKTGDCKVAADYLQQVADTGKIGQAAFYHLGTCYLNAGNKEYARTAFASASKTGPDELLREDAAYQYAQLAYELSSHPYTDAVTAINDYLLKFPDSPRTDKVRTLLVNAFMTTRNYRDALESLDRINQKSPALRKIYHQVALNRGLQLFNAGDYTGAIRHFDLAVDGTDEPIIIANARYWKADAKFRQNRFKEAEQLWEAFLEDPLAPSTDQYFDAYYNLGYASYKQKKYPESATWFRKYATLNLPATEKKKWDAMLRTGDAYFIMKDFQAAADYYKQASEGNLNVDYALFQQGITLGLNGQPKEKIGALQKLINNYPASGYYDDALYETGRTLQQTGRGSEAIALFRKVRERGNSPLDAKSLLQEGLIFYNEGGQDDKALEAWKTVVTRYPGSGDAHAALNLIKNLLVNTGRGGEYATYVQGVSFANETAAGLDSVTYESAEKLYMSGDCDKAVPAFSTYITSYPNGIFASNAHFYRGECNWKAKRFDVALTDFQAVLKSGDRTFRERSLNRTAAILYFNKAYAEAIPVYIELEGSAAQTQFIQEAQAGLMRSYIRTGDTLNAAVYAAKVIGSPKAQASLLEEANLISGLAEFRKGNLDLALNYFNSLSNLSGTEFGAIANYYKARVLFKQKKTKEAESAVFAMADKFSQYDYWLAKAFILLADIYVDAGDLFQAKATLQSIVDNYKGEDLKQEAQDKLSAIALKENQEPAKSVRDTIEIEIPGGNQ